MSIKKLSNLVDDLNIDNVDSHYLNNIIIELDTCIIQPDEIKNIKRDTIEMLKLIETGDLDDKLLNIMINDIKKNYQLYYKIAEKRISVNRDLVLSSYNTSEHKNKEAYLKGDLKAGVEYIYPNQKTDALNIINYFYLDKNLRVVSIVKRTKVGMDGLMIEIAKNISTHPDDNFLILRDNIFFITGMSNRVWEDDMKEKIPECFRDRVYHHGKIEKITKEKELDNIKNALIIIDEIDTGDKIEQKLHKLLKESKILNIESMIQNNVRFIFVSATMINELRDLHHWGEHHKNYKMSIPNEYIGHNEFLKNKIIQEFYPVNNATSAEKWITEDIINKYKNDYRVHIIRTSNKYKDFIANACKKLGIEFKNHTSDERIDKKELEKIFNNITNHVVIAVKGFYRRANLIPNDWKLKIGATMEKHVKKVDVNVQVQGLPGRMTGYWKKEILAGHMTGPHRTSIKAIESYEQFYENINVLDNKPSKTPKLLTHPIIVNIKTLEENTEPIIVKFKTEQEARDFCNIYHYNPLQINQNKNGFYENIIRKNKKVYSCKEIYTERKWATADKFRFYPCYQDVNDKDTLEWWIIYYEKNIRDNKLVKKNTKTLKINKKIEIDNDIPEELIDIPKVKKT